MYIHAHGEGGPPTAEVGRVGNDHRDSHKRQEKRDPKLDPRQGSPRQGSYKSILQVHSPGRYTNVLTNMPPPTRTSQPETRVSQECRTGGLCGHTNIHISRTHSHTPGRARRLILHRSKASRVGLVLPSRARPSFKSKQSRTRSA